MKCVARFLTVPWFVAFLTPQVLFASDLWRRDRKGTVKRSEVVGALQEGYWIEAEVRISELGHGTERRETKRMTEKYGHFGQYTCNLRNEYSGEPPSKSQYWSGVFCSSDAGGEVWSRGLEWIMRTSADEGYSVLSSSPLTRLVNPFGLDLEHLQAGEIVVPNHQLPLGLPRLDALLPEKGNSSLVIRREQVRYPPIWIEVSMEGPHAGSWRSTMNDPARGFLHLKSVVVASLRKEVGGSYLPDRILFLEGANPRESPAILEETTINTYRKVISREDLFDAWYFVQPDPVEFIDGSKKSYYYQGKLYEVPDENSPEVLNRLRTPDPSIPIGRYLLGLIGLVLLAVFVRNSQLVARKRG